MIQILLNDLLQFSEKELSNIKIKLNQYNGSADPIDLYQKDPEIVNTQWLFWRSKNRNFSEGQIVICFLRLTWDTWLLTTIKKVTKDLGVTDGIGFEGFELEKYQKYYGRVIVQYHKTHQTQCVYFENICDKLVVNQILPATFDGFDFPGYDNVRLSYAQLESIVRQNKKDWIVALKNQKAVYLITDKKTGKLYVGSATSERGMLLQRWSNYVANGHGGNEELKTLIEHEGFDYIKQNFQYSILENYNGKVDDYVIRARESWWKETLNSRLCGYNDN